MATPKKKSNSSVVTVKASKSIALPAGPLGFSSLVEPDTYDPEKPTLKLNLHLSPEAIQQFHETIAQKVYTKEALAQLKLEAEENGIKWKDPQSAEDWLAAKLKDARDSDQSKFPFIIIANKANYKNREGDIVQRKVSAWDGNNRKLDLKKLRMARGSIIQPVVYPNLFISKLIGFPQPSLKLIGVKVLKLERFGTGGSQEAETDEDAIKEVLGDAFEMDDLAAFAAGDDHEEEAEAPAADEAARLFGGSD